MIKSKKLNVKGLTNLGIDTENVVKKLNNKKRPKYCNLAE